MVVFLAELVLRLAGAGYPVSFFLPRSINGQAMLVENEQVARRFFPKQLLRRPIPMAVPAEKPADSIRIFIFGESAAMGDPDPSFSFGRILQVLLEQRFPETRFEVVNAAFTAINSHVIVPIARECADRDGDLWIVYIGNNEVTGPYGPGTVFGGEGRSLPLIRASVAIKQSRAVQVAEELFLQFAGQTNLAWSGLQMFAGNQILANDPRLRAVYSHFQHNLDDILEAGSRSGAKILLSTVASNLKDCPPFASLLAPSLSASQKSSWNTAFERGIKSENAGQADDALEQYLAAAALDPGHAELQFRLGRLYHSRNDMDLARKHFEAARDFDALRIRADSQLNQIIHQAATFPGRTNVFLVDAREQFSQGSIDGIPGHDFFFDHVHFNYPGNYALALAFAEEAIKHLPPAVLQRDSVQWATPDDCARRLALTAWNQYQLLDQMQRRLMEPPFTGQLNHGPRQEFFTQKLVELNPMTKGAALEEAAALYNAAISRSPNDPHLHENFAKLALARGDLDGALQHTRRFSELLPHNPAGYFNLGFLTAARNDPEAAMGFYREALRLRPDYAEPFNGIGQLELKQGRIEPALQAFSRALELRPNYVEAHLNLAELHESASRVEIAKMHAARALEIQPHSFAVRMRMANLLIKSGDLLEAAKHQSEAVRLQSTAALAYFQKQVAARPEDPLAHFQLANALAADKQTALAISHLRQAVSLKPDLWEAQYLLGVELAVQDQVQEATLHFSEAVRVRPGFAPARFNLAVALAKSGQIQKAAVEFRETVRLDPQHQMAQQYLSSIERLLRSN